MYVFLKLCSNLAIYYFVKYLSLSTSFMHEMCFRSSMILSQRPNDDDDKNGFTRWPFMTTHTWAELSRGTWTLDIVMEPIIGVKTNIETAIFKEWTLVLHGTKTAPYANQPAGRSQLT